MKTTIFALSSAPGRAGVAIVRVSGPDAARAAQALCGPLPPPRSAVLRRLVHAGVEIDQGLLLWFVAPHSFTGEDMAEFQVHGGVAVREALFAALGDLGLRPAEAGDFSRRAVENGKLDLTRAEAIADLIDAETEPQRRQALRQYDGALADLYEGWRRRLIAMVGRAEAAIDFSDDGVGEEEISAARAQAIEIYEQIQSHMADGGRGEALREGLRIALVGPPNAGKSSLINALARRDIAIVADTPGTTRDVVGVRLNLGGHLVQVSDTAGLRETGNAIEAEGVRRALAEAQASQITVLVLDGTAPAAPLPAEVAADLMVCNKSDLPGFEARSGLALSLKTGDGMDALLRALTHLIAARLEVQDEAPVLTRARHRAALTEALEALRNAQAAPAPELFAEDMRLALRAIGRITGAVDVEDVLDFVFRDFCIGK